jgi:outer membrane protein assembly factor BamB
VTDSWVTRLRNAGLAALVLLLSACGGGGDEGPPPAAPYIFASLISFPTGAVPPAFVQSGFNSFVWVEVLDGASGAPIPNASVSVNGVALAFSPAFQDYDAEIVVDPAQSVSLTVAVGGATYTASSTQFTAYPAISSPQAGATWSSPTSSLVAWSSVAPTSDSLYLLGVLDPDGQLIWPSANAFQVLPSTATSFTIGPGSLTAGDRFVLVGISTAADIPAASPGSAMVISGFNHVPVTVVSAPPAALVSIAVTPAAPTISVSKSLQLTATGTYSDNSVQDVTAQVTWKSLDTAKATVDATGLVTGVDYGSATVTATLGAVSGSATVKIFQPNPSPVPPLSQAVAYQIDAAHAGHATFGSPLSFPVNPTWSVTLNGAVSYPLIADGKVFVTTSSSGTGGYGTTLYALDKQTGGTVWGPVAIPGTYSWSGHAYDHGKIFVVNFDGLLRSFDAATGQPGWSKQLPGQYAFSAPPTAVDGIVYVGGAGVGGTVYAIDQSNGDVLWTAAVANGDKSSPAVSGDGVFVSYPCQVYKFDPLTGSSLWHYSGGCSGGGGKTPAYANGLLYVRDSTKRQVFDATTGSEVGTFAAGPIPAFSAQTGFFQNNGILQSIDLATSSVQWSFTGDGGLVSAPIVIDDAVIVGSSSGAVYAVDAATGLQLWSGNAGSPIAGPDEQNVSRPLTGLGAGEGYLVVPAGNVLSAWRLSGP